MTNNWILVGAFYLCCAALVVVYLVVDKFLCRPKFRNCIGDITSEVGYEEDPTGTPITGSDESTYKDELAYPHIDTPGHIN